MHYSLLNQYFSTLSKFKRMIHLLRWTKKMVFSLFDEKEKEGLEKPMSLSQPEAFAWYAKNISYVCHASPLIPRLWTSQFCQPFVDFLNAITFKFFFFSSSNINKIMCFDMKLRKLWEEKVVKEAIDVSWNNRRMSTKMEGWEWRNVQKRYH